MADYFSARNAFAITPSDTVGLPIAPMAVYVGGAGAIKCDLLGDGTDVTFSAVPAGTVLPIRPQYIRATGTTATLLLGLID